MKLWDRVVIFLFVFVRWFWQEPFITWPWKGPFELWLQIWWHVLDRRYFIRGSPRTRCVWCCWKGLGKQTSRYTCALALSLELAGFPSVVGILTLQMEVCNAYTPRVVTQMRHLTSARLPNQITPVMIQYIDSSGSSHLSLYHLPSWPRMRVAHVIPTVVSLALSHMVL